MLEPTKFEKLKVVNALHDSSEKVKRYFNKMQRDAMAVHAHDSYFVCSRGTGKSEGLDAPFILSCVWSMPGSTGAVLSPTYSKAWGNTLPAICHALAQWGYKQNIHYYVGRKAPIEANFKKPKREPLKEAWGNCFHFWNGTVMVVLSFNNGMSANSMSLDWILGPEAKYLNYDKIKEEVNPANRGNRDDFGDSPLHHAVRYTTDMPTTKGGKWILEKENEMRPEQITLIRNLYKEYIELKQKSSKSKYHENKLLKAKNDLNLARQYQEPKISTKGKVREYTVHYAEYDVFENLEVLGEDFIWQMKRDLPPLIFRTAILNERLFKVQNGFYSSFEESIHCYTPIDTVDDGDYLTFTKHKSADNCLRDTDLLFSDALHIAFDANAAICTCAVGQVDGGDMATRKSFFVKTPNLMEDLVTNVCKYYVPKLNKEIIFYFDQTFIWSDAKTGESYRDIIIRVFTQHGYKVEPVYVGQQPRHDWRYEHINMAFKGDRRYLFPTFNIYNNEYLKLALERTAVKQGKNGIEKDKSEEKELDSQNNPDQTKTHITDAWDTLWFGTNFHRPDGVGSGGGAYDCR